MSAFKMITRYECFQSPWKGVRGRGPSFKSIKEDRVPQNPGARSLLALKSLELVAFFGVEK